MSSTATSSKTAEKPAKVAEPLREDDAQPTLGVLEEDDEFEEFAVAGQCSLILSFADLFSSHSLAGNDWLTRRIVFCFSEYVDWDDSQTDLAHLGGAAPGAAKSGGNKLWEDNWDDDDIEDDFSVQLRWDLRIPCFIFPSGYSYSFIWLRSW